MPNAQYHFDGVTTRVGGLPIKYNKRDQRKIDGFASQFGVVQKTDRLFQIKNRVFGYELLANSILKLEDGSSANYLCDVNGYTLIYLPFHDFDQTYFFVFKAQE